MKSSHWLCVAQKWFVPWPRHFVLLKRAGVSSFDKCNHQSGLCREFWIHYGLFYIATAIPPQTFILSRQHCIGFIYTFWNSCFSWHVWSLFSQTSFQGFIAMSLIQWGGRRTKLQPTVEAMPPLMSLNTQMCLYFVPLCKFGSFASILITFWYSS
jgi:hypothetical protein